MRLRAKIIRAVDAFLVKAGILPALTLHVQPLRFGGEIVRLFVNGKPVPEALVMRPPLPIALSNELWTVRAASWSLEQEAMIRKCAPKRVLAWERFKYWVAKDQEKEGA